MSTRPPFRMPGDDIYRVGQQLFGIFIMTIYNGDQWKSVTRQQCLKHFMEYEKGEIEDELSRDYTDVWFEMAAYEVLVPLTPNNNSR